MRIPDVVGTGVGIGPDGLPAIKVFTARHGVKGIPEWLESTPVRTEVTGRFYALRGETCETTSQTSDGFCTSAERWPFPVPTGVSVGHPNMTAGTIAARVTDGVDEYILSNNHVLANINQAAIGDPILQPGIFDGGVNPGDAIANLTAFEPIRFCTLFWFWVICNETNSIDAAIAKSEPGKLGFKTPLGEHNSIVGYGVPSSTLHPAYGDPGVIGDESLAELLGAEVQKYGRTTGLTTGNVNTINATVNVCYDSSCTNIARFTNQLVITPGTFSAAGDSGSLVVDSQRRPVGLLFAGSDTQAIINRIDFVLNRFGVAIDEGTVAEPTVDVAITGIDVDPAPVVVDQEVTVTVTVENRGQLPVTGVVVKLDDLTEAETLETPQVTTDLRLGESQSLEFLWTPTKGGSHTLEASHQLEGDDNPGNDRYSRDVNVLLPPGGPQLQLWKGLAYTDHWETAELEYDYGDEMVVICSSNYDLSAPGPAIVRVKNASGSSFEVGVGRPWYGGYDFDHFSVDVYCMIVRQGVYTMDQDGVKMEAVKLSGFTLSDHKGSWFGLRQAYQNAYTSPVVVGQVVSPHTGIPPSYCPGESFDVCEHNWSVFWSPGRRVTDSPSSSYLYVGRHTGEDPNGRAAETLMYLVIESGTGNHRRPEIYSCLRD